METILIIEDDQYIVDLISIHLKDLGFRVEQTENGKAGDYPSDTATVPNIQRKELHHFCFPY